MNILTDGPELVFRCPTCGHSLCAAAFMFRCLGLQKDQVFENLRMSGYNVSTADDMVKRDLKYLKFLDAMDEGRYLYRQKSEAMERKAHMFGDWGQFSGDFLNAYFFTRLSSKLIPKINYGFLLMRDENGIPSSGKVHTLLGSCIGEMKLPISCGKLSLITERWTDFVPWTDEIIMTTSTQLASLVGKTSAHADGTYSTPVACIDNAGGSARYFSRSRPDIKAIVGENEHARDFSVMHDKMTPVSVYRLPGNSGNEYALSGRFEDELSRIRPISLARDICLDMKHANMKSVRDFCSVMVRMPDSSPFFRNEMVDTYCLEFGEDKSDVSGEVNNLGSSLLRCEAFKKTFKIHDGQYCEWGSDFRVTPISNFWIQINYALSEADKSHPEYNATLHIGNRSSDFFAPQSVFRKGSRILEKVASVAMNAGMDQPTWVSNSRVEEQAHTIIMGLSNTGYPILTKFRHGMHHGQFSTEKWICNENGLKFGDFHVGETFCPVSSPSCDESETEAYLKRSEMAVARLCSTTYGAACLSGAMELVCSLFDNDEAHIVAPKNVTSGIAKVLGVSPINSLVESNAIQYIERIIPARQLMSAKATISIADPDHGTGSRILGFRRQLSSHSLDIYESLLPFLCHHVFLRGSQRTRAWMEETIKDEASVSNFRLMSSIFTGPNVQAFVECLASNPVLREYVVQKESRTIVFIDVFSAMRDLGHVFSKPETVSALRKVHPELSYPVRSGTSHRRAISIPRPNIIEQEITRHDSWKKKEGLQK